MYVNGCVGCPFVPMNFAMSYWTSYTAYHEAAFSAFMNNNKNHLQMMETLHREDSPDDAKRSSSRIDELSNLSVRSVNSDEAKKSSKVCLREDNSPLGHLRRLSPSIPSSHRDINSSNSSSRSDLSAHSDRLRDFHQMSSSQLKFGITRILSDEVGIKENGKGKSRDSIDGGLFTRSICPCSSPACPYLLVGRMSVLPSSLSAVHAIQPPQYPVASGADALPGPYSVLTTDPSCTSQPKRKRSWSRAVFSQLQRKGLEKRFEVQKYVTKPDRRQLAAMLGLTDAQVKVWFQNRRMKWRHAEKSNQQSTSTQHKSSTKVPDAQFENKEPESEMSTDSDDSRLSRNLCVSEAEHGINKTGNHEMHIGETNMSAIDRSGKSDQCCSSDNNSSHAIVV